MPGIIVDDHGRVLIPFAGRDYPISRARLVAALPFADQRTIAPPVILAAPSGAGIRDPSGVMLGCPQRHVGRLLSAGRVAMTRSW